ncbi:transposase, partial [Asaia sp. HN128]|uniref:transposase n=1 Tax=Asaia sp. HN128 TaxID=3081234 RepID=UPI003018FCB0
PCLAGSRPQLRPRHAAALLRPARAYAQKKTAHASEQVGAELRFLPPYSPDFNPIENAFAKLKAYLRKAATR